MLSECHIFSLFCAEMLEDGGQAELGWLQTRPGFVSKLAAFQRSQRAVSADPHRVTHTENPGVPDKDK